MFLPVCLKRISSNLRFLLFFRLFTVMPFCRRCFFHFFPTSLCGVLGFDSVSRICLPASSRRLPSHILFHPPSFTHTIYHTPFCHTPSFRHHRCHTPSFTHNYATHLAHTPTLSHTTLSHTIFHTQLCHTPLCHTPLFHTQLCHTLSFLNPS